MKARNVLLNLFLLLFLISGCDFNDQPAPLTAKVNFHLVDAPAPYDEVWIEVLGIRVKADYEGSAMGEDDDTWEEIMYEGSKMVNLLDLTGGNRLLLGTDEFAAGEIDQIRLMLGSNNYLMEDGQKTELTTPSAQQSGLKIKINEPIRAQNTYNLVIDFDAARSIVNAGNSGKAILKPVLRAYMEAAQGIQGRVFPGDAYPVRVSVSGNGTEVNTFVNDAGDYSIMGLTPGTYKLTFTPNEHYFPQSLTGVVIEEGKITNPSEVQLQPRK